MSMLVKQALEVVHERDPREEIMEAVGAYLDDIEPLAAGVMVVVYERPEKTKGGILLADRTKEEDLYQGKVGLVVKMGNLAFVEDESHVWGSAKPKLGDWVVYRVGDTFPFIIGKRTCRLVQDVNIRAILNRPDIVL
jgi:co-chaperonin GroES (HSP10)